MNSSTWLHARQLQSIAIRGRVGPAGAIVACAAMLVACASAAPVAAPASSGPDQTSAPSTTSAPASSTARPASTAATGSSATGSSGAATSTPPEANASTQPNGALTTVHAGGIGGLNDITSYVALDKNFYGEQGLQVDLQTFKGGVDMLPALATNRLDFMRAGSNAAIFNAIGTGLEVKVVGTDLVLANPKTGQRSTFWIVVRKQLAGQIKSIADLKGRSVAIGQIGSMGQSLLERVLEANNLQPSNVKLVEISYPDQVAALANGAVDAAQMLEPYISTAESKDIGIGLYDEGNVLAGLPQDYVFYSPSMAAARGDVGKKVAVAHLKAIRYIDAALRSGTNKGELIQILINHTTIKDPKSWEGVLATSAVDRNGSVDTSWLEKDQEFFVRIGQVKKPLDLSTIVDQTFWKYAVQVVGA